MRLLFTTTNKYLPEFRGGMEVNTHQLALALIERGLSVGVLCGLGGWGLFGLATRLRRRLLRDRCPKDITLGYPVWRSYDPIPYIAPVAAAFRPDVIVVQEGARFGSMISACLGLGRPVLCYLHTPDRLLLPKEVSDDPHIAFVANSNFQRSMHPDKRFLGVVPPLVPTNDYATATDRSCAVFINPGPHKGVEIVLGLANSRPDVPFLFVVNRRGHTPGKREDWKRLKNVKVVGPVRDMRKVYRRARVVVAPSQWLETWGRVATEAHFSGIPVLASDRGGLPEAVGPGGICVAADAPFAVWLDAFARIWDDPVCYRRLSEAARRYSQRREISRDFVVDTFVAAVTSHLCQRAECAPISLTQSA